MLNKGLELKESKPSTSIPMEIGVSPSTPFSELAEK